MLSEKILNLLNEKINDELYRSNQFLEISGWASDLSLKGVEGYFIHLSTKARANVYSLIEYVNQTGHHVQLDETPQGLREFENIEDVFVYLRELELGNKARLQNLLDECMAEQDFSTYFNLADEVKPLHADEFFIRSVLDKIKIVGKKGLGLYLIDKDLEELYPIPALPA